MDEHPQPEPDEDERLSRDDQAPPPKRPSRLLIVVVAVVVIGLIVAGVLYWLNARHYENTDDAFIDGHVSQVSSQVSGRVIKLLVRDNQEVRAGDVLVELDPRDLRMRLEQARAARAQQAAQLEQARANLPIRQADAAQAAANTRSAEADQFQAQRDFSRYHTINPQAITRQLLDNATASTRSADAKLDASRHAAEGMRAQIAAAQAQVAAAQASLDAADVDIANDQLQLSYTRIVAPADGRVTRRTVELGNYISPGQSLLAVVQSELWVTANFKEAQLRDMHPGQAVQVAIDAFPDHRLDAHVDSLQAGTGSLFSSLPAENATGNYVKVVQRLPVKIVFDGEDWHRLRLAPGMSVEPRVTVR